MRSPFSLTGLAVGTGLSLAVGLLAPYGLMLRYWRMGFNPSSQGAIFLFFILVFAVNGLVSLIGRRFELSRADLVLVYCMLLMAVTLPTWGLMFFLIGTMVFPYYYATTENRYAELFHDLIPSWMVPQDARAISLYYEGLPKGAPIPWGPWVEPLAWWFLLIMAIGFMLICLSSILHRQWSVHERLTYPMMQLPQSMIEKGEDPGQRIAPFFKDPAMWLGFALPVIFFSSAGLNHFFPAVPEFSFFHEGFRWFRNTVSLVFAFSFAWVGFFYLANLEITFSVWFFYLFCKLEEGIFKILGIASTEKLSTYEFSQPADLTHQSTGAVVVLVLFALWTARSHLRQVALKVLRPAEGIDDSEELLGYRAAVLGFAGSLLVVCAWLWRSGVPLPVVPVLVGISLVFWILVARAAATAGVATVRSPIVPAYFIVSALGAPLLGAKGLVALNFTFIWQGESRTSPMVACAHSLKLAEMVKGSKRLLFWGLILALACSFCASAFMVLRMCYTYGAINLYHIDWAGAHGWPNMARTITELPGADLRGWVFKGIGAFVEGLLVWAQQRWFWWPLHPLGFAIGVGWLTGHIWFSAMVSWGLKLTILHYWGPSMFQRLKPFFLGMIVGECCVNGGWGFLFWLLEEQAKILTFM